MKTIRAVIFDRDDTLIELDPERLAAIETRIVTIVPGLPRNAAELHWYNWPGPWPRTATDEPRFWRRFWTTLAQEYGLSRAAASELMAIGAFYHTCFRAFDDVALCLRALRAQGIALAVLTNFELPSVDRTLAHVGLDPDWFTAILSSTTLGIAKPDPRAYLAAATALGLPPSACMFVDNLQENVAGACDVGMHGLLLDRVGTAMYAVGQAGPLQTGNDERFTRIPDLTTLVHVIGSMR